MALAVPPTVTTPPRSFHHFLKMERNALIALLTVDGSQPSAVEIDAMSRLLAAVVSKSGGVFLAIDLGLQCFDPLQQIGGVNSGRAGRPFDLRCRVVASRAFRFDRSRIYRPLPVDNFV